MQCTNIKCPYYKKPGKRDWFERSIGVKEKSGGCNYGYCKLSKRRKK